MQRRLPLLLALALSTPVIAGDDTSDTSSFETVMTMRIDGDIEVATDGTVKAHTLTTTLDPAVRAPLEKAIAAWRFKPPMREGKPAEAHSKMRIALVARESDKDYIVEIENVSFGKVARPDQAIATSVGKVSIPERKLPAYRTPASAIITVLFHIDQAGKVLDVASTQCAITAMARNQNAAYVCKRLERDTVAALRTWKFDVTPGGTGETATTIPVALWFQVDPAEDDKIAGKWRREMRSAYRPAPWRKPDEARVGTADVTDGGLMEPYAGLTLEDGAGRAL